MPGYEERAPKLERHNLIDRLGGSYAEPRDILNGVYDDSNADNADVAKDSPVLRSAA